MGCPLLVPVDVQTSHPTALKGVVHLNSTQFLIVDGSSVLVRAFFASAFRGRIMQTASGIYTNAVFGFLNMLISAIKEFEPSHLFIAWDVSRDTFRRELYPAYKGTRGELPAELLTQFDTMRDVLDALRIAQYQDERYEADDILGTLASQAAAASHKVTILTGDRDALQLVGEHVTVSIMKKGVSELEHFTPSYLLESWGLTADQIPDLKGLMGDTSDNIPGVPGIGEKTAKKLLDAYDTLENVISHSDQLKGKVRERIETHQDLAILSKRLATIITDVPLSISLQDCLMAFDLDSAAAKFQELELHRPLTQLKRLVSAG
jgi:5'-3' exonuclease